MVFSEAVKVLKSKAERIPGDVSRWENIWDWPGNKEVAGGVEELLQQPCSSTGFSWGKIGGFFAKVSRIKEQIC